MSIQTATEVRIPQGNVTFIEQGGRVIWERYTGVSTGDVPVMGYVEVTPHNGTTSNTFNSATIFWGRFQHGVDNPITRYEVWAREANSQTGTYGSRFLLDLQYTNQTYGSFVWTGVPQYPMYYVKNVATGKYLDLQKAVMSQGTAVHTGSYNGGTGQRWSFEPIDGNYMVHVNDSPGHVLNVYNSQIADGTGLEVYRRTENNNQKFKLQANSDGTYLIIPLHAIDKCLDVDVSNDTLRINTTHGGDNQKWILEDASNAWNGKWYIFNVVAVGTRSGTYSATNVFTQAYQKI